MVMIMIFLLCDLILIIDLLSHSHPSPLILFSLLPELWWIFKSPPLSLWKHQRRLFTSHELYEGGEEGRRVGGQWTNIVDF